MIEFSFELFLLMFCIGAVAGWVDTIAGGGGLIAIPALILAGLPPAAALATNKLQGCAGSLTASLYFIKKKTIQFKEIKFAVVVTFIGSVVGSWLVLRIDSQKLIGILPLLLVSMGVYFLVAPNISDCERKEKLTLLSFSFLVTPFLGFYDGFFGPGTGTFMALAFVILLGYSLPKATAHSKILNFTSNIAALSYFLFFGDVYWSLGLVMIGGQYIGATFGAKMIVDKGTKLIKPVVVFGLFCNVNKYFVEIVCVKMCKKTFRKELCNSSFLNS